MIRRSKIVLLACVVLAASCSSGVSEELRPGAVAAVGSMSRAAGLGLSDVQLGCVADELGDEQASVLIERTSRGETGDDLADVLGDELTDALVDGVITCAGTEGLASAALAAQAPGASEESIRCAADALDSELFRGLVLDRFAPQPSPGAALELDVSFALATCLTPEELLDLAG